MPKRGREESSDDEGGSGGSGSSSESDIEEDGPRDERMDGEVDCGAFSSETGALTRTVKSFKPKASQRGYGKHRVLDDHPFLRPQIMLVAGATGVGKTTVVLNILEEIMKHIHRKRLERVIYYTGSPNDPLLQTLDPDVVEIYGPEQSQALVEDLAALRYDRRRQAETSPLTVVVLDDVGNNRDLSPNNAKGTEIGDILVSHRHLHMLIIFVVQKVTLAPTFVRTNWMHLFFWPGRAEGENKLLLKEIPMPTEGMEKALRAAAGQSKVFLWVDLKNRVVKRNFDQVVLR